jgi:hypothetical protein
MIEVFVFFLFYLFDCCFEYLGFFALQPFRHLAKKFPVKVILRLCLNEAFCSDQLSGFRLACSERHFH